MPHEAASSSTVKAEGKLPYIRPTPRIIGGSLVRAAANVNSTSSQRTSATILTATRRSPRPRVPRCR